RGNELKPFIVREHPKPVWNLADGVHIERLFVPIDEYLNVIVQKWKIRVIRNHFVVGDIDSDVQVNVIIHRIDGETRFILIVRRVKRVSMTCHGNNPWTRTGMDGINVNWNCSPPFTRAEHAVNDDRFGSATCGYFLYTRVGSLLVSAKA